MDEIDSQILCALIVDSRASVTELSELVGKSHSATRQEYIKLTLIGRLFINCLKLSILSTNRVDNF